MKKYVPINPEPVEAVQWLTHGDHPDVLRNPQDTSTGLIDNDLDAYGYTNTQVTVVYSGDYVINGPEGLYTMDEDEFNRQFKEYDD